MIRLKTKKSTTLGPKLQLVLIIWPQVKKACVTKNTQMRLTPWRTYVGSLLITWTAWENAADQNSRGRDAWARRVNPMSTTCRCLLSATPFCSEVWGHVSLCWMPSLNSSVDSERYSPPVGLKHFYRESKLYSNHLLKMKKACQHFRFSLDKVQLHIPTVHIYKGHIVRKSIWFNMSWSPNVRYNKLKW